MSRRRTLAEGWEPRQHGIPSSYNRGCRCDECKRAHAERHRERGHNGAFQRRNYAKRTFVAGRWIAPLPDNRHGTVTAYNDHGCRCVRCTVAAREYRRSRKEAS